MKQKTANKKIGAVLVQGGGIAGVQASLDLANSGFKVYLIERSSAIGGMMSQLDKTFPTGDCATCTVSPKLVEAARNLNIEIHTFSELIAIEGEPGRFKASIKKSPRYVDHKICNDCQDCSKVCPVDIKDPFNRSLSSRKAIAKQSPQAIPNIVSIMKLGHAPCKIACPAKINVQGYIQLIKKKEYVKAVNLIRERNPLSGICGRVCTHPCESECRRNMVDSAVAIRQLKRFASDKEMEMIAAGLIQLPKEKKPSALAKKVAVIGAGPSGLTVADDLAKLGYSVTVFEESGAAGGMLRWGIPKYRLPLNILDHEVDLIRRNGVSFVYNCKVGKDISFEKLRQDFEAVYVGIGFQKGSLLGVKGENLKGVKQGLEFLRQVAESKEKPSLKEEVVVIGGGNVAIDAARTALRSQARKVTILYRRTLPEMPAMKEEIDQAAKEGVQFQYLTSPIEFYGDQNSYLNKIRCIKMKLGTPDESGRRRPEPVKGSEFEIKADMVLLAIGSQPDMHILKSMSDLPVNKSLNIITDSKGVTSLPGVFAGGDIVTGPLTVIDAVAAGKRAAQAIDHYLQSTNVKMTSFEDSLKPIPEEALPSLGQTEQKQRSKAYELPVQKRVNRFSEIEQCFTEAQALYETERCLNCALCSECGECVEACEKKAINHSMVEEVITLDVGSVILAPGFEEFHAALKGEYGFGRYKNVITSVQFERMLSAAGPFQGHVKRLSDGGDAKRIAWIQCVGSRDAACGNDYCSAICCMAATKQAIVAQEHIEGFNASIFYMDIRAFGKNFDQYYERAKRTENIEYLKSIPSRIIEIPGSMDLRIRFINEKFTFEERDFDLVVLTVGLDPKPTVSPGISRLGISLNEFGFCKTNRLFPLTTSTPGVFVAGAFQEPKDIPETVIQASAAASLSMELLSEARNSLVTKKSYPVEHDVTDELPRVGVFVCHCGINIASVVDVSKVTQAALNEPGVVMATNTMYTCSDASLSDIKETIRNNRLNRIVVASCTPRTHEPLFRDTMREAGLNPYLFELANIRDQCSWVHSREPEAATEKAIDLVKMAIARSRLLSPLIGELLPVDQTGLVIGGGLSGMTAALSLANQNFQVHLIEQSEVLGGHLLTSYSTLENDDISGFRSNLIHQVQNHPGIKLHLNTRMTEVAGHIGKFKVKVDNKGVNSEISCGVIIVATGAKNALTTEYRYGQTDQVITQHELCAMLHENRFKGSGLNLVMIQCVGSRNKERAYCSRICCATAIENALKIKEKMPDANIYILYRDIRTYGFRETYYKKARMAGVVFIRYDEKRPPLLSENNGLLITVNSPDFPEVIEIEADKVILSTGIEALSDNRRTADLLKVSLNEDGFFVEAHLKLRPVDFTTEGIFLCGLAHSPKFMDETIAQSLAAAARAATVLSKKHLEIGAQVAKVDQNKCISCMTCVNSCHYGAPFVNRDHKAEIATAKCMGCGICSSECPAMAIQLRHFEAKHFNVMIDNLNKSVSKPKIVAFCCHYCAYAAADLAGSMRLQYPANVRIIRMPCTGKLESSFIMRAFENGADGVLVAGCEEGSCHFSEGNLLAKRRVNYTRNLLSESGLEKDRLRMVNISAAMGTRFSEIVNDMVETVKKLGQSPIYTDKTNVRQEICK